MDKPFTPPPGSLTLAGRPEPKEHAQMNRLPGKFVWFEHVSNDVEKARAFYEPLFGWRSERMQIDDQQYLLIPTAKTASAAFAVRSRACRATG